ncbi:Autocrine proliferation repressor protein A [Holothuria leucospilota]|uniref:Autocrine proliferation repressor protein A n=1 Tax=Holothuria leucospilota TaxID=206669 RepID=A0A9Q1C2C7_HOLLE|nr:Autocrine proliferation repressor protein A [Holothuria leucospilota]
MAVSHRQIVGLILFVGVIIIIVVVAAVLLANSESNPGNTSTEQSAANLSYKTLLADYVFKPDDSYSFSILDEYTQRDQNEAFTSYVLNVTSQTWLTEKAVDRSVWWHHLIITVPDNRVFQDLGVLFVSAGTNEDGLQDPLKDAENRVVSYIATQLGVVTAVLRQVPNQPITFTGDHERRERSESDLLAYTLRQFMEGTSDDCQLLLLFPMVKAVVRALDTLENFTDKTVNRYYISGSSERGWAAWLAASLDDRIVGVAPLVYGNINFIKNLKHHHRSLSGYSWAYSPYWTENLTHFIDDPMGQYTLNILDPLSYSSQLDIPKFIILAGNDEWHMPDSTRFFYDQMIGPTFLRIYPNTDNSLFGHWHHMADDCIGFILTIEKGWQLPEVRWVSNENSSTGSIVISTNIKPTSVTTWSAVTPSDTRRRDFRLSRAKTENSTDTVPQTVLYQDVGVETLGPMEFKAVVQKPQTKWVCFFIELIFPAPNNHRFSITTEVSIVPDSYPIKECYGRECVGTLV